MVHTSQKPLRAQGGRRKERQTPAKLDPNPYPTLHSLTLTVREIQRHWNSGCISINQITRIRPISGTEGEMELKSKLVVETKHASESNNKKQESPPLAKMEGSGREMSVESKVRPRLLAWVIYPNLLHFKI